MTSNVNPLISSNHSSLSKSATITFEQKDEACSIASASISTPTTLQSRFSCKNFDKYPKEHPSSKIFCPGFTRFAKPVKEKFFSAVSKVKSYLYLLSLMLTSHQYYKN